MDRPCRPIGPSCRDGDAISHGRPIARSGDVTRRSGDEDQVELLLPDGGHVIVSFADAAASADGGPVIDALIAADGSERDVEREIVADLDGSGLTCQTSSGPGPTVLVISKA